MAELPFHDTNLLHRELATFYSSRREHYLVAVYGTGEEGQLTVEVPTAEGPSQGRSLTVKIEPVETVPNQDGAGVVDAVGPDVVGLSVGDRVWLGISGWQRPLGGTAQDYTIALAERVFPQIGRAHV